MTQPEAPSHACLASGWPTAARLRRHDLAWLQGAPWRFPHRAPDDDRLAHWIRDGHPFVVRRRHAGMPTGSVALGAALPLDQGRQRIALVVDRGAIVRCAPPLSLPEVVDLSSGATQAALHRLASGGRALDTLFRVYGSHAWQALTGKPCVTADSDIDLLWDARDADHVARVLDLLSTWERTHRLRADGEARFPDGAAVAWRELLGRPARVLVKRDDRVALEPSPIA